MITYMIQVVRFLMSDLPKQTHHPLELILSAQLISRAQLSTNFKFQISSTYWPFE